MKKTINIVISEQARLLLDNMPELTDEQIITWRCSKDFHIGSVDILEYLEQSKGD